METPLRALKLAPRGMGVPELVHLAEAVTPEGQYGMTMRFYAPNTPYSVWKDRSQWYARFFGPNVRATLKKYDASQRLVELSLISIESGESDEGMEVLEDGSTVPILTSSADAARREKWYEAHDHDHGHSHDHSHSHEHDHGFTQGKVVASSADNSAQVES